MISFLSFLLAPVLVAALPRGIDLDHCINGVADLTPSDGQAFVNASAAYNLRLDPNPVAVAYPKNASEVSKAIACGRKYGRPISARGGGHSVSRFNLSIILIECLNDDYIVRGLCFGR